MRDFIVSIEKRISDTLGFAPETQEKIALSLIIILVIWLIRFFVLRIAYRSYDDVRIRYRWRKASNYLAYLIGILVVGRVWVVGFGPLSTYLGLVSAGVAIALKDLLTNLAGWTFILWRRPFSTGDRIQIGEFRGDVIDTRLFQFSILEVGNWVDADQSTGRIINVPNGKVFTEPLANYTIGFDYIWDELPVLLTFESNWEKAKQLLTEIVERRSEHLEGEPEAQIRSASHKYMIFFSKFTPIVYTSVEDSGVLLTMRFLTKPRQRRSTAERLWEDILREFAKCDDVDFAYPTQRFYNNVAEGKSGARAAGQASGPGSPSADTPSEAA